MRIVHLFRFAAVAILFFCVLSQSVGPGFAQAQPDKLDPFSTDIRSNTILVKPRPGVSPSAVGALHASNSVTVIATYPRFNNLQVLKLPAGLSPEKAVAIYGRNSMVEYAEPDYIYRAVETQNIPNDLTSLLWAMNNTGQDGGRIDADIDAPEAWSLRTDASPIIVGVVDTGIDYTHPDLAANVWTNPGEVPGNGIDDDGNGIVDDVHGINAISGAARPGDPMDDQATTYHGTHISGTIGASGNNGLGVVGVAWNVQLMGLKFLNSSGSGSSSDAIKCIDYAIAKGARVLSNSWGGGGYSQALYDAIDRARAAGLIFVAAAGNSGADTDSTIFYPAGYALPNIVAVASTDRNDLRSSFSNYGYRSVELGAPGSSIYSTKAGASYQAMSGTSMATPHVSGALALMAAHFPALPANELIQRLLVATDPVASMASTTISGGRLNLYKALSGASRPIPHFTASPQSGEPGVLFTFTDSSLGNITTRTLNFGDGSTPVNFGGTATHSYANPGTYTATLTVTSPDGTATRTRTISVQRNYSVAADTFQWVDTSAMAPVTLGDDAVSAAIPLPFPFPYYGQNYSTLYIGSNGLATLGSSAGAAAFSNTTIPSTATPNAALYPFWDDLNPAGAATSIIRHGASGENYVVSWEGVPVYGYAALPLTFQIVLAPTGVMRFQYLEVQPANPAFGAGRSATVGVEAGTGLVARQHSYNGSTLLANHSALRFTPLGDAAPAAPSGLTAAAVSGSQINLAWTDNSSNETGFRVERSTNGATFAQIATVGAGVRTYSNTGLSAGTLYYYRVRAYNTGGSSAYSNVSSATTLTPPAAPTNLAAVVNSSSQITLTWTDNANNETGYRVQRSTDGVNFTIIATLPAGAVSYINTGLSGSTTYYYRVLAYSAGGQSAYASASATTLPGRPAAPSSLKATAVSRTEIRLTWNDNSGNETSFLIERLSNGAYGTLATVPAGTVAYSDTGLTAGFTYAYRVKARNSYGDSAYTNLASATTPP